MYEELRKRLVEARKAAGLTRRDAALKLVRSHSFIAKSEAGERRVDFIELAQFAALYGKPIGYFIGLPD